MITDLIERCRVHTPRCDMGIGLVGDLEPPLKETVSDVSSKTIQLVGSTQGDSKGVSRPHHVGSLKNLHPLYKTLGTAQSPHPVIQSCFSLIAQKSHITYHYVTFTQGDKEHHCSG